MSRTFHKVIMFHVEGEIYDDTTDGSDIINDYAFSFNDYSDGKDHFFIEGFQKNNKGRITNITKIPKIHKYRIQSEPFMV